MNINEILLGLRCEECERGYAKKAVYKWETDELYIYTDLGNTLRVFCKECMTYFNDRGAIKTYDDSVLDKTIFVGFGAKKVSELLEKEE